MRAKTRPATRDLVVPCGAGKHRVRLKGGLRFFSRARCPKCGSTVDPQRWQRVLQFVRNLRQPASPLPLDRWTWIGSLAALAAAVVLTLVFRSTADLWWPSTVLLFGPRWVVLIPFVPLMVLAWMRDRALLVPLVAAVVLLTGSVLGFRTGLRGLLAFPSDDDITVASFNAAGGVLLTRSLGELIVSWDADIAMIQECTADLRQELGLMSGWYADGEASLCVVSRYPIVASAVMDREAFENAGGSALVATFVVEREGTNIRATNLHLETPREGLQLISGRRVSEGVQALAQLSFLRELELARAERWASGTGGPAIVIGDFNSPSESKHLRNAWGSWRNAFSVAGFGTGGTRMSRWYRARIDHVMVDDEWTIVGAWVGNDVGSDHLPIFARLRLRNR